MNLNPNPVKMVHIADIHFGAIDPRKELEILSEQFINKISQMPFDILSIDGDLFDRKFSANSMAISCAIEFVNMCANLCLKNNATMVMISGTESHEAGQLSLFYGLGEAFGIECFIVEHTQFINTKGLKVLCIPEEYGRGASYYDTFLKQTYDLAFVHGTIAGAIYGKDEEALGGAREPVFSLEAFGGCRGCIISGHVHTAQCLRGYMYYVSSPIRYRFGEEEEKGYAIVLYNPISYRHYYQFMPIKSFRYDTINIGDIVNVLSHDADLNDPNILIDALKKFCDDKDDIYIRLDCSGISVTVQQILMQYLHEHKKEGEHIKLFKTTREMTDSSQIATATVDEQGAEYAAAQGLGFLLNDAIDPFTKFVMYMNYSEQNEKFIDVDELKKLLSE